MQIYSLHSNSNIYIYRHLIKMLSLNNFVFAILYSKIIIKCQMYDLENEGQCEGEKRDILYSTVEMFESMLVFFSEF